MDSQEIWKDIKGYEGLYQISNHGRLKALTKKSGFLIRKEKIMKIHTKANGYVYTTLFKNNKGSKKHIHRLVAEAFIPNPNNYPCINHKDHNKRNNNVENLEWCSYKQNNDYSACHSHLDAAIRKPIAQYDLNGNFIKIWESSAEIGRYFNIRRGNFTACCKGKIKTSCGYVWKYA